MGNFKDLTDQKFGRLTVVKNVGKDKFNRYMWLCKCDCGNDKIVMSIYLKNGDTKSCGCLRKEMLKQKMKKYNNIQLFDTYGTCFINDDVYFYFDLEDYDKIKNYYWNITENGYIVTKVLNRAILLHRVIMNLTEDDYLTVDHINHNTLDNRKYNLRVCTMQKNSFNKGMYSHNTSGVKGVYYDKDRYKWVAQIKINRKPIYLGSYIIFEDAVKARQDAEEKYFGEFSYENSMKDISSK